MLGFKCIVITQKVGTDNMYVMLFTFDVLHFFIIESVTFFVKRCWQRVVQRTVVILRVVLLLTVDRWPGS
jgi:hypothetical protein